MSQSETIRNGIVTSLQSLLKTNGGPVTQIFPYAMSNMTPPTVYVTAGETEYDYAGSRGADVAHFTVVVLIADTLDKVAQQALDQLRDGYGTTSVKQLLEADRTLGGACQSLSVTKVSRPQIYETVSQPARVGCEWTIEVLTNHP